MFTGNHFGPTYDAIIAKFICNTRMVRLKLDQLLTKEPAKQQTCYSTCLPPYLYTLSCSRSSKMSYRSNIQQVHVRPKRKREKKCSTMWLIRFSEWIRLQIWFERSEKCKQLKPMQLFINSAGLKLIHSLNQQSKSCGKKEQMTNMKISLINSKIYVVLDKGWKSMCYNHMIYFSVCYQIE